MITFLASLFIKDRRNYNSPEVRQAYGILSGAVGIGLNILLFLGKWIAGTVSGSIAITADAFNNLSDAGSSIITLIGFRLSGQEPDPEHPFGHGRMEYISGLLVSVAILVMGFELIWSSLGKLRSPEPIESSALVCVILIASILVKVYMFFYNRSLSKKLDSAAMKATSVDSLSDTVATTLVLIATLISKYTGLLLDGWFGILVGCFILYTGGSTLKETIDLLIGQPPKQEFINEIHEWNFDVYYDWWLAISASYRNSIIYIPCPLVFWRRHDHSMTLLSPKREKKIFKVFKFIRRRHSYFQSLLKLFNDLGIENEKQLIIYKLAHKFASRSVCINLYGCFYYCIKIKSRLSYSTFIKPLKMWSK